VLAQRPVAGDGRVRDFAIFMLLARLGLRSAEVSRLELGDLDWRAGEIVVRGQGRSQDRLPLLADVARLSLNTSVSPQSGQAAG
jgi:integrase